MARETARYVGGATDEQSLRTLLKALEKIFISIAAVGAIAITATSGAISQHWLQSEILRPSAIQNAVILMALIIAVRWMTGLYRGVVTGFESLVWLNAVTVAVTTARSVLVIPFLKCVSNTPAAFFVYQLIVAIAELALMMIKAHQLIPQKLPATQIPKSNNPLTNIISFSTMTALTGAVWVLITQTDKLYLSGALQLKEYANYTLAVMVAGGILQLSAPVSSALLPRMTQYAANNDLPRLIALYRKMTQVVAVVAIPIVLTLSFFPEQVMFAWTGNPTVATSAAGVLRLYALGNAAMIFAAFGYYVQYAYGNLRLHLAANIVFSLIYFPTLIWAVKIHGQIGAGYAWLLANIIPLALWLPVIHKRMLPGVHKKWLTIDIGQTLLAPLIGAIILKETVVWGSERATSIMTLALSSILIFGLALASSGEVRAIVKERQMR